MPLAPLNEILVCAYAAHIYVTVPHVLISFVVAYYTKNTQHPFDLGKRFSLFKRPCAFIWHTIQAHSPSVLAMCGSCVCQEVRYVVLVFLLCPLATESHGSHCAQV